MTWYKAIFVFPLAATLLALFAVYRASLRQQEWRKLAPIALAGLVLGASPLIAFNVVRSGATFAAVGYIGQTSRQEKLGMMARTLEGRALEHYMFRSTADERLPLSGTSTSEMVLGWYRTSSLGMAVCCRHSCCCQRLHCLH